MLKWCRGGVWGGLPPQESLLPVPCPPGGSGGLGPPGISVNYPCLAPAATMPCPRFFSEFFRPIFFRTSVRRPSVRRPSVVRPSVRRSSSVRPYDNFFDCINFWPKKFSPKKFAVRINVGGSRGGGGGLGGGWRPSRSVDNFAF